MKSVHRKTIYMGIAVLTTMCLLGSFMCVLGSIVWCEIKRTEQVRKTEQEKVSQAAHEIADALYTPDYAVVLDEVEVDDLLAYAPDCTGTVIEIAYGTYQSFRQVSADYHHALLDAGWILHPGYTTTPYDDLIVYKKDRRVNLSIEKVDEEDITLTSIDPTAARYFPTIYIVMITYTEPSNLECTG